MKRYLLLVLALVLILTAAVQADDLSDVKKNGVLRMGSAPEYVPFVYYGEDGNMTGIDVELMKEIGRRMGVEVQTVDIAFDGLIDSLKIGQVDVIARGMSRTESRLEDIDFSRIYFKGQAQFIALASLNKPASVDHSSFKGLKIGVQKATSFEQWIRDNLVKDGSIEAKDVYLYSTAEDLVKGLDRKDVDLIVLDQDVFEKLYKTTGNYQIFYDGFLEENYAFGLAKGSTLTAEIDQHLTEMLKDGTAQKIANEFFTKDYTKKSAPIPEPAVYPTPVPVMPVVVPTPAPATCVNSMAFAADVTISDGQEVAPGEHFRKIWRVINNGTCTWNYDYSFVYVSGNQMNGSNISVPGIVGPGQSIDLAVDFIAPYEPATYKGYWQMRAPQGLNFGETIWVKVRVGGGQPSYPTPTPEDGQHFVPININSFYADSYEGYSEDCVNVYWSTTGAAAVRITVDGRNIYQDNVPNGWTEICGPVADIGAHEIELEALNVVTSSYSSFWYTTIEHATGLIVPDDAFDGGWAGANYYENEGEFQGGWAGANYQD